MAEDSSFLSRWSRRKVQARQADVPPDTPEKPRNSENAAVGAMVAVRAGTPVASPITHEAARSGDELESSPAPQPPPPTLEDVATLTPESDFARFVKSDVSGEVRNAALKKLFADPHFNVMDGLDTYIEDFNKTTPLPLATIRQMAQSAFLGLAEPPPAPEQEPLRKKEYGNDNDNAMVATPPHTEPEPAPEPDEVKPHDENPDLRLQSLDTPGSAGPQPGT